MTELDLDELFHLAIYASGKGDHDKAILHLKAGIEREESARFYYLLGAEHAEIGMYQHAIENIGKALSIDPEVAEAWFQLGLLHALCDDKKSAVKVWAELDQFSDKLHLITFKNAIQQYFSGNVGSAIETMRAGMELNTVNPVLNKDMLNLMKGWEEKGSNEPAEETDSSGHFFLSAYQNKH